MDNQTYSQPANSQQSRSGSVVKTIAGGAGVIGGVGSMLHSTITHLTTDSTMADVNRLVKKRHGEKVAEAFVKDLRVSRNMRVLAHGAGGILLTGLGAYALSRRNKQ